MRVFKIRNIIVVLIIAVFSIINAFSYNFNKADYESKIEMIENETKIWIENNRDEKYYPKN